MALARHVLSAIRRPLSAPKQANQTTAKCVNGVLTAIAIGTDQDGGLARRMHPEPANPVVDAALRVNGVGGLRVIDASVLPGIPQAMVNAATIAVAERASDLVLAG